MKFARILSAFVVIIACSKDAARRPVGEAGGQQGACTPSCDAKVCGDDGCGGSCGSCSADTSCSSGVCIGSVAPAAWTCDPEYYAKADGCDCDCGAYDPDCMDPEQQIFNCVGMSDASCDRSGACVGTPLPQPPEGWTCPDTYYGRGDGCDCGCGGPDPDCADPAQDTYGCTGESFPNARCSAAGTCEPSCSCADVACGDDGCGNSCGSCADTHMCDSFECILRPPAEWTCDPRDYSDGSVCDCNCGGRDPDCESPDNYVVGCSDSGMLNPRCGATGRCEPSCDCTGAECGDNGCGTSCGSCGDGLACYEWECMPPAPAGWTCHPGYHNDGLFCDCRCGTVRDPDCAAGLPTIDCDTGTVCENNACVPG